MSNLTFATGQIQTISTNLVLLKPHIQKLQAVCSCCKEIIAYDIGKLKNILTPQTVCSICLIQFFLLPVCFMNRYICNI